MSEEHTKPKGLAAIGFTVLLISGFCGLYALGIVVVVLIAIARTIADHKSVGALLWNEEMSLPLIVAMFLAFTASSIFSCWVGRSLRRCKRWAAYVTSFLGAWLIYLGIRIIRDLYQPLPWTNHSEDGSAGVVAAVSLAVGLWWCIYLNLPHVRRHLRNSAVAEPPSEA